MPRHRLVGPASLSLGFALILASTSASFAKSDDQFLAAAIQGDNSEMLLGQLAQKQGGSPAMKSFGATLEGDHSQSRIQAVRLADLRGMIAPTAATSTAAEEIDKLKGLTGAAFDKEFAHYMVEDHEKDIAAFTSEARSGEGPVARFAKMALPVLEKHLQMAQSLEKTGT